MNRMPVATLATVLVVTAGCVHIFYEVEREEIDPSEGRVVAVQGAIRAHLADGGVAIFRGNSQVGPNSIVGQGIRYDFTRLDSLTISELAMDSVVGIEAFQERVDAPKSVSVSVLATAGAAVLTVGTLVAIACINDPKCFGSCPTVYTGEDEGEFLEAELFSYSIAPLLEGRDVDVLRAEPDEQGVVRLNVRNEAMETHFINHLQLLEVAHGGSERVVPDHRGAPVAFRGDGRALEARDGDGRDVSFELGLADDSAFSTTERRLAAASEDDLLDHIDLVFPRPRADSAALVLRLRNSLLNTVLFYDMMLGSAGAEALNWMGTDLARIGPAVQMGRWWSGRMGMRVAIQDGGTYREVERIPDTGPIAWSDLAVVLPVPPGTDDELRVRLSFPADEWRIDRVALAPEVRRPAVRTLPAARVMDAENRPLDEALAALQTPDEDYVRTMAGDRFVVEFEAGAEPSSEPRTFLLSSQGYYTEWIRPDWIRGADAEGTFQPSDASLLEAMRRWRVVRPEFELAFYNTRIPTR